MSIRFTKKQRSKSIYWIAFLLLLLIVVFSLRLDLMQPEAEQALADGNFEVICDAEDLDGDKFSCGNYSLSGGNSRSDEMSLSGKYSLKLDKGNRFGFEYIMEELIPSKRYVVSVWSKNPHPCTAYLVVSAPESDQFYKSTHKYVERNGDYWNKRELSFQIPEDPGFESLKIYVYKDDSENAIYFDDFELREVNALNSYSYSSLDPVLLDLSIDKSGLDYLSDMKSRSIAQGVIYHDDSKIKVKLRDEGKEKEAKLRIKGDWLDHIAGYTSFRIDMNSEESWQGMQSFSVQEPSTRGHVRNWVFFKFLDHADVLHPRSDFIWMQINKEEPFIFSYEEHFTKNLVEFSNRREGPIVKLTEDRIWDITKRYFHSFNQSIPGMEEKDKTYWRSEIRAFKEKKTLSNPKLKNDFDIAHNLMYQFKYDLKPASDIFDVERLAKYMALVDVCLAKHAITWHNQRFYYNPVTAVLEPIGFDAYTSEDPDAYAGAVLADEVYSASDFPHEPLEQLLYDDAFAELYFKYLYQYSDPEFIQAFLDELEEGIKDREYFLNQRFNNYSYDREEILNKAKKIRIEMEPHKGSLQAFRSESLRAKDSVYVYNMHSVPMKISYGNAAEDYVIVFPFNQKLNSGHYSIPYASSEVKLKYQLLGMDTQYEASISEYDLAKDFSPRQSLGTGNVADFSDFIEESPLTYNVKKGVHNIKEPVIIPKGKTLVIEAGTELHFDSEAFLISYSNVRLNGTEEEPIIVKSLDGTHGSFTVMQADSKSYLRNVIFKNQNTLNYKKWTLTGAVNFYESDVDMYAVQFMENNCEDALNIIRSEFQLSLCSFLDTYGDAFDSDFCQGEINSCLYRDSGNDAIDASGSQLSIINCTIERAGDKGVSGGEMSKLIIKDCRISDANIGLASKDRSELHIDGLKLKNCNTGITAYQKKPEFGPASLELYNYEMEDVKRDFMIEEGSELKR